ncbi:MAG: hypothetical protein ACOZCL_13560 [Bacillota bacterium]
MYPYGWGNPYYRGYGGLGYGGYIGYGYPNYYRTTGLDWLLFAALFTLL